MASSLIGRRAPSIAKLLKPYHPSSSSAYACLFSQASGNPNRELDRNPTFSRSASIDPAGPDLLPRGRGISGAAFDPVSKAFDRGHGFPRAGLGPISLLDQKARFSSSAAYDPDKYNEIHCIMKSLHSKSKVLVALSLADLVSAAWVSYSTPASSMWDWAAQAPTCLMGFGLMVFFNYVVRYALKSPNFAELREFKPFLLAGDFAATYFVIAVAYLVVQLDTLLA